MTVMGLDEYALKLSRLGSDAPKIAKVVRAGANPIGMKYGKGSKRTCRDPRILKVIY